MKPQRVFAFLLIAIEAVAFVYMLDVWAFPVVVLMVALFGASGIYQRDLPSQGHILGPMLIVAGCTLKWFVEPYTPEGMTVIISGDLRYIVIQSALICQVALLFIRSKAGIAPAFPLFGAVALIFVGAVITYSPEVHLRFGALSIAYAALAAMFYATSRRLVPGAENKPPAGRWILITLSLLGALVLSGTVAFSTHRFRDEIDDAFYKMVAPVTSTSSFGFSDRSQLGSVSTMKGSGPFKVGLRVYADAPPDYLRGKAYTNFNGQTWSATPEQISLTPMDTHPEGIAVSAQNANLFQLGQTRAPPFDPLDTRPAQDYRGVLFAPLDAVYASADVPRLGNDDDRILNAELGANLNRYVTFRTAGGMGREAQTTDGPQGPRLEKYLALPTGLDPRIRALERKIFDGHDSTSARLQAIQQYFSTNYDYKLGITIPSGEDPLTYFLLEKPPAHCEYFAAGTALLLRIAGIPCRYVTGFFATELNPYGQYYVARNKDAHAWVEAYDADRSAWVLVESTPPAGMPSPANRTALAQFWDYLKQSAVALAATFGTDMRQFLLIVGQLAIAALTFLVTTVVGWLILLTLIVLAARRIRKRPAKPSQAPVPTHIAALHALLATMDRHMLALNLTRAPSETAHQFAGRINIELPDNTDAQRHSAWYKDYAVARFRSPATVDTIEELRRALAELDTSKRAAPTNSDRA